MKKLLIVITAIAISYAHAAAAGESGGLMLLNESGARPAALAGAFTAKADDVNAVWYNPAGIALLGKSEVGFTYNRGVLGFSEAYVSGVIPMEDAGGTGFMIAYSGMPEIDYNTSQDPAVQMYDMAIAGSYSYAFESGLSLGINAKYFMSKLGDYNASSIGCDLGMVYRLFDEVAIGLVGQNIGTGLKFDSEETPAPLRVAAGIDVVAMSDDTHLLTIAVDGKYLVPDKEMSGAVGVEYTYGQVFTARGGYMILPGSLSGLTLGAGTKAVLTDTTIKVDYAFTPKVWEGGGMESSHLLSLIVIF